MPELRDFHYSDSQPLTPEEQFVVMHLREKEISKREKPPSVNDVEVFIQFCFNLGVSAVNISKKPPNFCLKVVEKRRQDMRFGRCKYSIQQIAVKYCQFLS